MLREFTPTEDGDFTYEKFEQRYNADLAGGIGNLVARTVALAQKLNIEKGKIANANLKKEIKKTEKEYKKHLDDFKFNESLKSIWELMSACDKYINEEKPWEAKENAPQVIADVLFVLGEISQMLSPFLPETSEKIQKAIATQKTEPLFPRLEKNLT